MLCDKLTRTLPIPQGDETNHIQPLCRCLVAENRCVIYELVLDNRLICMKSCTRKISVLSSVCAFDGHKLVFNFVRAFGMMTLWKEVRKKLLAFMIFIDKKKLNLEYILDLREHLYL